VEKGVSDSVAAVKYRSRPAPSPKADCSRYCQRDFRPLGSRLAILIQSSYQPIAPKAAITASTSHTYLLRRSPHSSTEASTVSRISPPPMVGVPALEKWLSGPSLRIGWPLN